MPVTELKQWVYCRRIVYYHRVLGVTGRPTYKMTEAIRAQDLIEGLEMRRCLTEYGLEGAERIFGRWMTSQGLGLSGKADLVLRTEAELAIVDYKLTAGAVAQNHRMQLAGYGLLAEETFGGMARMGFIYRIPDNRIFAVDLTGGLKDAVRESTRAIAEMAALGTLPEPTVVRKRCEECEYANYCGDVW